MPSSRDDLSDLGTDGLLEALAETESPALFLPSGTEVADRYRVRERLGAGGMGVVYRAHDPRLGRDVAIKVLLDDSEEGQQRLLREATAMARLSHPNVVTAHDVGRWAHGVFVAMELVEGRTLRRWLEERPRSWREVRDVFLPAGEGLRAIHEAGLVHRDFKPGNVLIDGRGRVRVADLGLSRAAGEAVDETVTPSPSLLFATLTVGGQAGTPGYMPPEQLAGGRVDARADQFAFCVALAAALPARAPARLRAAVDRGRSPAADDRFPSMAELLRELRVDPARTWRRAGLAAGVLALAGLAAAGFLRDASSNPCGGARLKLAGIWDDAARTKMTAAFRGTGLPYAEESLARVAGGLDRWADRWSAMHTEACEATAVRREQSEVVLDLRMRCLDRLRLEAGALVDRLGAADATVVENAGTATGRLGDVAACADVETLGLAPAVPPEIAPRVQTVQAELTRATARWSVGERGPLREELRRIADAARDAGYLPLAARARLQLAVAEAEHDHRAAVDEARETVRLAALARDDATAQRAWSVLVDAAGRLSWLATEEDAATALAAYEAAVERSGGAPLDRAQELMVRAELDVYRGRVDRALGLAAAALAIRLAVLGPIHEDIERVLSNMSVWARIKGDLRASVALSERTLGIAEVVHGPEHPRTAWALSQLGASYYMVSRLEEMRAVTTRSLALFEKSYGPRSRQVAMTLINLGALDIDEERFAEAAEESGRSVAIFDELLGAESKPFNSLLNLATAQVGRGEVAAARAPLGRGLRHAEELKSPILLATALLTEIDVAEAEGRPDAAAAAARRGLEVLAPTAAQYPGETGLLRVELARLTCDARRPSEGLPLAREGLALLEKDAPDSLAAADGLAALGECQLAAGDASAAASTLRRALAIREAKTHAPRLLARTRFALARATSDRRLAESARAALAATGPGAAADLRAIDSWLR